jgi:NitT/TauT family transport system permease protein
MYDADEERRARKRRIEKSRNTCPVAVMALAIWYWDRHRGLAPGDASDHRLALARAVIGGGGLAVLFSLSRWIEMSLFALCGHLQVTPIVAIAPLIFIYVESPLVGAADLRVDRRVLPDPVQHHARPALRRPQPARPVHHLRRQPLAAPAPPANPLRLPYFLGGLKIAGGLSLIGAVVAEFAGGRRGRMAGWPSASSKPPTGSTSRACSPPCS